MEGFCTKCGKAPPIVEKGAIRLCEKCAIEESKKLFTAVAGGKSLDQMVKAVAAKNGEENLVTTEEQKMNIVHEDFLNKEVRAGRKRLDFVEGVEVIFVDDKGNRRLVRTPDSEQMAIADKIIKNRAGGKREFQYADVSVLPVKVAVELIRIVEELAGEVQIPKFESLHMDAKKLIEEMKGK